MKTKKTLLCLAILLLVAVRSTFFYFENEGLFAEDKKVLAEVIAFYICALSMRFLQYRFKTVIPAVVITVAASACDILLCGGVAVLYLLPVSMLTIAHNSTVVFPKKEKGADLTVLLWILAMAATAVYLAFEFYRLRHGMLDDKLHIHSEKYYYIYYALLVFAYGFLAANGKKVNVKRKLDAGATKRQRTLYVLCVVSFLITAAVSAIEGSICFIFPFFDFWCVNLIFLYLEDETILVSRISRFKKQLRRFLLD